jgi:hypothetical protein
VSDPFFIDKLGMITEITLRRCTGIQITYGLNNPVACNSAVNKK